MMQEHYLVNRRAAPLAEESAAPAVSDSLLTYSAELSIDDLQEQPDLIDWLIDFAFGTIGARVLELRVRRDS